MPIRLADCGCATSDADFVSGSTSKNIHAAARRGPCLIPIPIWFHPFPGIAPFSNVEITIMGSDERWSTSSFER